MRVLGIVLAFAQLLCSCRTTVVATQAEIENRMEDDVKLRLSDGLKVKARVPMMLFQEALSDSTLELSSTNVGTLYVQISRIEEISWRGSTHYKRKLYIGGAIGAVLGVFGGMGMAFAFTEEGVEPTDISAGAAIFVGIVGGALTGVVLGAAFGRRKDKIIMPVNGSFDTYKSYFSNSQK